MGFLGKLIRTAVDVAILPISTACDVITMGLSLTDGESMVKKNLEKIRDDVEELAED